MSTNGCSGFCKNKKDLVSTHSLFTFLLITHNFNKIKKNSEHTFVRSKKHKQKYNKKTLNFMVAVARQGFHFFKQMTSFLRNNGGKCKNCLNICIGFCITSLVLSNYKILN